MSTKPHQNKSPEMRALLARLFPKEEARIERGECPFCGKPCSISDMRDELSRTEYLISGLCQECQDDTFEEHPL